MAATASTAVAATTASTRATIGGTRSPAALGATGCWPIAATSCAPTARASEGGRPAVAIAEEEARAPEGGRTRSLRPVSRDGAGGTLWILIGLALALLGAGAVLVSTSFDKPRAAEAVGRNLPVNEGARNGLDLSAHNSPSLVRNPVNATNLVAANRVDSPRYSCALHVSFDGGGHWNQTAIPAPRGEEPK